MGGSATSSPFTSPSKSAARQGSLDLFTALDEHHHAGRCSSPTLTGSQLENLFNSRPDNNNNAGSSAPLLPPLASWLPPAFQPLPQSPGQSNRLDAAGSAEVFVFPSTPSVAPGGQSDKARHCCFLFQDWDQSGVLPKVHVAGLVERLCDLKEQRTGQSILLTRNPTFYRDRDGLGHWVVLSSNTTKGDKWKKVGAVLKADQVRPVYQRSGIRTKGCGFDQLIRDFALNKQEQEELYSCIVECARLPEARHSFCLSCFSCSHSS